MSNSLGVELPVIVNHHVDGGNQTLNLLEQQSVFLLAELSISLALPVHLSFTFVWVKSPW